MPDYPAEVLDTVGRALDKLAASSVTRVVEETITKSTDIRDLPPTIKTRTIAEQILGIRGPNLPPVGTPKRKEYQALRRSIERYRKPPAPGAETRTPSEARRFQIVRVVRRIIKTGARKQGAPMQLRATIIVSQNEEDHTMPIGGPWPLSARDLGPVLDLHDEGSEEDAAALLLDTFFELYWPGFDPKDLPRQGVSDVEWITLAGIKTSR